MLPPSRSTLPRPDKVPLASDSRVRLRSCGSVVPRLTLEFPTDAVSSGQLSPKARSTTERRLPDQTILRMPTSFDPRRRVQVHYCFARRSFGLRISLRYSVRQAPDLMRPFEHITVGMNCERRHPIAAAVRRFDPVVMCQFRLPASLVEIDGLSITRCRLSGLATSITSCPHRDHASRRLELHV
jgi:hypothetical protein